MAISNEQQERRENLKARLRFATKTVSEWLLEEKVILEGEPTIAIPDNYVAGESDISTFKPIFKIGDGVHAWKELPEVGGLGSSNTVVLEKEETDRSDVDFLNEKIINPTNGMFTIVVDTLVEDDPSTEEDESKKHQTAYIYDDKKGWVALDGNYSADTVYFDEDFTLAGDFDKIGNYKKGEVLNANGKSLNDVMRSILTKELEGTITKPSCTITLNGAGSYEVGTKLTPTYTTTFEDGWYSYGPEPTGVTPTKFTSTLNSKTVEGESGSFEELIVSDGMNIKAVVTVEYSDGVLANTNLGNVGTVRISNGSCTSQSSAIVGYRNMFYKVLESDVELSSAVIRTWNKKNSNITELVIEASVVSNPKSIVIVTLKPIQQVLLTSAQNSDITTEFKQQDDVIVNGESENTGKTYMVYKYQPASLSTTEKYKIIF